MPKRTCHFFSPILAQKKFPEAEFTFGEKIKKFGSVFCGFFSRGIFDRIKISLPWRPAFSCGWKESRFAAE
jgi:hypothetical protein